MADPFEEFCAWARTHPDVQALRSVDRHEAAVLWTVLGILRRAGFTPEQMRVRMGESNYALALLRDGEESA